MSDPRRPDIDDFAAMLGFTLQPWQRAFAAHVAAFELERIRNPPPVPKPSRGDAWRALVEKRFADGGYFTGPVPSDGIPARLSPPRAIVWDLGTAPDLPGEVVIKVERP